MCSATPIICREIAASSPEHALALKLRELVLRKPLGLTWTDAEQAAEPLAHHFAAFDGLRLVGTLLLVPLDGEVLKMRQVAVYPEARNLGVGRVLVGFAEEWARERGWRKIVAHARDTAVSFYRRLGYAVEDEIFLEVTIPHRRVEKLL